MIDAVVALRQPRRMERRSISSPAAPAPVGAYSPAVHVSGASDLLFVSGQIGLDPDTGKIVEGGVTAEAEVALRSMEALLGAAGFGWEHVVRCTLYLVDMNDFAEVNALYAERFPGSPPARAAFAVAALPKGARFEIDAIAAR